MNDLYPVHAHTMAAVADTKVCSGSVRATFRAGEGGRCGGCLREEIEHGYVDAAPCSGPLMLPEQAGAAVDDRRLLYCAKCKKMVVSEHWQIRQARDAAAVEGFKPGSMKLAPLAGKKQKTAKCTKEEATLDIFPDLPDWRAKLRSDGRAL